jgi:hypothetical protein
MATGLRQHARMTHPPSIISHDWKIRVLECPEVSVDGFPARAKPVGKLLYLTAFQQ